MALTFPLALNQFFNGLPISQGSPELLDAYQISETAGGEMLSAAIGNRLWQLEVAIATRSYAEGEQIKAKLDVLRYPGRSLLVHSFPLIAPQADPKGVQLGSAIPRIQSVASNNREITISGLPIGYVLTPGDFLSFTYGSNPTRYAMHQIAVGGTANSGGVVTVEISYFVASGWSANAAITLIKPVFKAVLKPGAAMGTSGATRTDGIKFTLIQTFR